MLKVPELRSLCRTFRIPSATRPKQKLIQALLDYGKGQQSISGNKRGDSISLIKSRYVIVYVINLLIHSNFFYLECIFSFVCLGP
jgi:hypothetical protein